CARPSAERATSCPAPRGCCERRRPDRCRRRQPGLRALRVRASGRSRLHQCRPGGDTRRVARRAARCRCCGGGHGTPARTGSRRRGPRTQPAVAGHLPRDATAVRLLRRRRCRMPRVAPGTRVTARAGRWHARTAGGEGAAHGLEQPATYRRQRIAGRYRRRRTGVLRAQLRRTNGAGDTGHGHPRRGIPRGGRRRAAVRCAVPSRAFGHGGRAAVAQLPFGGQRMSADGRAPGDGAFDLLPAIDVRDGRTVRLRQGDYARETRYDDAPLALAARYADAGARWLHLVDLDAARAGGYTLATLLARIVGDTRLQVQTGGGVRCEGDVAALLDAGASRVVVGSLAVREPERVAGWLHRFGPERITIALDVRQDRA